MNLTACFFDKDDCHVQHLCIGMGAMKKLITLLSLAFAPMMAFAEAETKEADSKPEAAGPKVLMKTSLGDIVIELDAAKAPITTANFLSYVDKKFYDGTIFHRVIDNFMIQGGGFALQDEKLVEKENGDGIQNEGQNGLKNLRGTIAMARTNDPNSATSQFFINVVDNAMLDFPNNGGYAVFGKVVKGMDVVDQIKSVATEVASLTMRHPATGEKIDAPSQDVPKETVKIISVTKE